METRLKASVRSNWSGAVLVCGKCSKKVGGGFGDRGRTRLAKALRKAFGLKKGRKGTLGVVEVKCLGVCPKNAVTVVNTGQPDRWHLVPAGTAMAEIGVALGMAPLVSPTHRHPREGGDR